MEDLKNTAFGIKFYECTTQQLKKQYDMYVQYWSIDQICIKMLYCGTIMVEHWPSEKPLEHFLEFVNKVSLDMKVMIHIGMNGPRVNLKFEGFLKSSPQMKSLDTTILQFGLNPLHVVHNAFQAGVNALNFSIDSFVIDINFFKAFYC